MMMWEVTSPVGLIIWAVTVTFGLLLSTTPRTLNMVFEVPSVMSNSAASPGANIIGSVMVCDDRTCLHTPALSQVAGIYSIRLKRTEVILSSPDPAATVIRRI